MPNLDTAIISYVVKNDALSEIQRAGVTEDDFVDEYRTVWRFITRTKREQDTVPSATSLRTQYPDLRLPKVEKRDIPVLLRQLRQRRKYKDFLTSLTEAAQDCTDFEAVDGSIQMLQARLNTIGFNTAESHLVDLFSERSTKRMIREVRKRARGQVMGTPTGLERFDTFCGGLHKQKMVVVMARPGIGKSWLDLLFVATSVLQGKKVILYTLEMNIFETATRLYTLFSS